MRIAQLETNVANLVAQVEQEQACLADKNVTKIRSMPPRTYDSPLFRV